MERDEVRGAYQELQQQATGFMASRIILTAVRRDLFNRVPDAYRSLPEIRRDGEDGDALRRVCEVLERLDLLEKDERGRYRCSAVSRTLLTDRGEPDMRPIFRLYGRIQEIWGHLDEVLEEGPEHEAGFEPEEFFDADFTEAMEARAFFEREEVGRALGEEAGPGRLLDVGGGSGVYARSYVRQTPGARAVIADFPDVVEVSERYIRAEELQDRVRTRSLDLVEAGDYGEGFDLVLIGYVLRLFPPELSRRILRRACRALKPGGILAILDLFDMEDPAIERQARFFDVMMMMVTRGGRIYPRETYEEWLGEMGAERCWIRSLEDRHDLLLARVDGNAVP